MQGVDFPKYIRFTPQNTNTNLVHSKLISPSIILAHVTVYIFIFALFKETKLFVQTNVPYRFCCFRKKKRTEKKKAKTKQKCYNTLNINVRPINFRLPFPSTVNPFNFT